MRLTREELKAAADKINRERKESGWGLGYYDIIPDATIDEAFDRAIRDRRTPDSWGGTGDR